MNITRSRHIRGRSPRRSATIAVSAEVEQLETRRLLSGAVVEDGFFSVDGANDVLVRLDPVTGGVTTVGELDFDFNLTKLTFVEETLFAVTANADDTQWNLVAIDPATAAVQSSVVVTAPNGDPAFRVDGLSSREGLLYVSYQGSQIGTVDPVTGRINHVVGFGNRDVDGMSFNPHGQLVVVDSIAYSGSHRQVAFWRMSESPYQLIFANDFVEPNVGPIDLASDGTYLYMLDPDGEEFTRLDPVKPPNGRAILARFDAVNDNLTGLAFGPDNSTRSVALHAVVTSSEIVDQRPSEPPAGVDRLHEWQTFYVDVYVETPHSTGFGVEAAGFDLAYDPALFTATSIEFGSDFLLVDPPVADAEAGTLRGIAAEARGGRTDVAADALSLLARVKFRSAGEDNLPLDLEGGDYRPVDLGLAVTNAHGDVVGRLRDDDPPVAVPGVDVFPVTLDLTDDGAITFADVSRFASVFGASVETTSSPYASPADVNGDGRVAFGDFPLLVENYQRRRGDALSLPEWYYDVLRTKVPVVISLGTVSVSSLAAPAPTHSPETLDEIDGFFAASDPAAAEDDGTIEEELRTGSSPTGTWESAILPNGSPMESDDTVEAPDDSLEDDLAIVDDESGLQPLVTDLSSEVQTW